jgi:hypothetical protein
MVCGPTGSNAAIIAQDNKLRCAVLVHSALSFTSTLELNGFNQVDACDIDGVGPDAAPVSAVDYLFQTG